MEFPGVTQKDVVRIRLQKLIDDSVAEESETCPPGLSCSRAVRNNSRWKLFLSLFTLTESVDVELPSKLTLLRTYVWQTTFREIVALLFLFHFGELRLDSVHKFRGF